MQQILLNAPAVLEYEFDSDPGAVNVEVFRSNGVSLLSTLSGAAGNTRSVTLSTAQTGQLDTLRVVWTSLALGPRVTYVRIAGSYQPGPFISTQDVVDYLGRGGTADPGIIIAADAACDVCRAIAEQTFSEVQSDTVVLDGTGTDALLLPELPVIAVTNVTEGTTAISDYSLNGNGILYRGSAGVDPRPVWPSGRQNISVTYDHGYDGFDLPRDVRMVALSIASRLVVQGVALEETVGDVRVKYGVNATDLTNGEARILAKYRRIR